MYLTKHSPTSTLGLKIPEEVWSGQKVTVDLLRRFGFETFVHVIQDKVSHRATKIYFLGYPQGVKSFRVLILKDGKCTISRNVGFHENKVFKDIVEKDPKEFRKAKKGKSYHSALVRLLRIQVQVECYLKMRVELRVHNQRGVRQLRV